MIWSYFGITSYEAQPESFRALRVATDQGFQRQVRRIEAWSLEDRRRSYSKQITSITVRGNSVGMIICRANEARKLEAR